MATLVTCVCGNTVADVELIDTSNMPEFVGNVACSGCRFLAVAEGRISWYTLALRSGASPEKLEKIREKYGE